jgi:hypothetical protein
VQEQSKDNPVFYVQYAHARISSLKRKAAEAGLSPDEKADLSLLDGEELALVKLAAQYPRVVEGAAMAHEPHRVAFYLYDLAAAFHALWNRGNDDPERRFLPKIILISHEGWNWRGWGDYEEWPWADGRGGCRRCADGRCGVARDPDASLAEPIARIAQ